MNSYKLIKGKKYQWTMGAEYLEVIYTGKRHEHKNIPTGVTIGKGYIFEWAKQGETLTNHIEIGPQTVKEYIQEIETSNQ